MTNREFFLEQIKKERPVFMKIIKALPEDKFDYKPHDKARTAGGLASQLAMQPAMISLIVVSGVVDFSKGAAPPEADFDTIVQTAEKNFNELEDDISSISDKAWEDERGALLFKGGKWEDKKFEMAWGFLFDAIHHRGQLSTYLRILGEKVPAIYGGSADEPMG